MNFTCKFSVVYREIRYCLFCQKWQCWHWRELGSHQSLSNFSPHKQPPRACPAVDCWLLAFFPPLDGTELPTIFRVSLNWPISRFLYDSVTELFFLKEASDLPVLFCGQVFLDNGYPAFIVNIPYYCLLIYLALRIFTYPGLAWNIPHSEDNLELSILLPSPPQCWDYRMENPTWHRNDRVKG